MSRAHFTYVTTHSPTLPSLYLHHSSFSNRSVASHTSQFILQPFFRFSYVTISSLNSPGEPSMLILQNFCHFTYVETHFTTLPSLCLRHSSFSKPSFASPTSQALRLIEQSSFYNPSVASPTSQLILQPFRWFTYVTVHSPTLLSLLLRHKIFTKFTCRAAHESSVYLVFWEPMFTLEREIELVLHCIENECNIHCLGKSELCVRNYIEREFNVFVLKIYWFLCPICYFVSVAFVF